MIYIHKDKTDRSKEAAQKLKDWKNSDDITPSGQRFDVLCKKLGVSSLWELLDSGFSYNKKQLREDLHTEQHGVCCYCICGVKNETSQSVIEHFKDKSCNPCENTYDYANLMLSCNGNLQSDAKVMIKQGDTIEKFVEKYGLTEEQRKEIEKKFRPFQTVTVFKPPLHCDKAKAQIEEKPKNQPDYVSPIINPILVIDCWKRFEYYEDGFIKGKDNEANETIRILNLNAEPLKEKREKAWVNARVKFQDGKEHDLSSKEKIEECLKKELDMKPYHLCVVHRAYLLNELNMAK